jgi:hypothetical protein
MDVRSLNVSPEEKVRASFLKKRSKRLLRGCRRVAGDSRVKIFGSFFKKNTFLAFPSRSAVGALLSRECGQEGFDFG